MDFTELDIEYVVADEAFDIHPPHPDVVVDAHVDEYFDVLRARAREMLPRPLRRSPAEAEHLFDFPF